MQQAASSILVIGAGVTGRRVAELLSESLPTASVTVLDKGRGGLGRVSTRRSGDADRPGWNHGAPQLTMAHESLKPWIDSAVKKGILATYNPTKGRWSVEGGLKKVVVADQGQREEPRVTTQLIVAPKISSLSSVFGGPSPIFGARVTGISRSESTGEFSVKLENAHEDFDESSQSFTSIVVTTPTPQTTELLTPIAPELASQVASQSGSDPVWCGLIALKDAVSDIPEWIELEGSLGTGAVLYRHSDPRAWTVHCGIDWSRDHLEEEKEAVAAKMAPIISKILPGVESVVAHRWRFGKAAGSGTAAGFWTDGSGLYVAGESAVAGGQVGGALVSAQNVVNAMLS